MRVFTLIFTRRDPVAAYFYHFHYVIVHHEVFWRNGVSNAPEQACREEERNTR